MKETVASAEYSHRRAEHMQFNSQMMQERDAFAGSILYRALVKTTPELQGGN